MSWLILLSILTLFDSSAPFLKGYEREEAAFGSVYHRARGGRLEGWVSYRDAAHVAVQLDAVESRLGRTLLRPITVILVPDSGELSRLAGRLMHRAPTDRTLGLTFPSEDLILVREDDPLLGLRPERQPDVTLIHELAHAVVHRTRGVDVPRWFDEGIAMWVSGSRFSAEDEAFLNGLARLGGLFREKELERTFPTAHFTGSIAYQQSLLMVRFLIETHGEASIRELLDELESGDRFDSGYENVCGVPWSSFEPEFRAWMISRTSLLRAMLSIVNWWTVITVMAIVAIVVRAVRRRKIRARLEEDDRLLGEDRREPFSEGGQV